MAKHIYVYVPKMGAKKSQIPKNLWDRIPRFCEVMRAHLVDVLNKDPMITVEDKQKERQLFQVDGSVAKVLVTPAVRGDVKVDLMLSLVLSRKKSMFGFLTGKANVQSGKSVKELAATVEVLVPHALKGPAHSIKAQIHSRA